jgi:hypothetical protein
LRLFLFFLERERVALIMTDASRKLLCASEKNA